MGKRTTSSASLLPWLSLALLIFALDQLSKWLVVGHYGLGQGMRLTDWFNIVRVHNTGAAFSFLASASGWQRWLFTGIGVVATGFMFHLLRKHAGQRQFALAIACILGGALGNVLDRVLHGHVVDFLDLHWGLSHFPTFNLADCAITLGAALLFLDELRRVRRG